MKTLSDKGKWQNSYIFEINKINNPLASLIKKNWAWEGEDTHKQHWEWKGGIVSEKSKHYKVILVVTSCLWTWNYKWDGQFSRKMQMTKTD